MLPYEVLEQLNASALKEVCAGYKLKSGGTKTELFERIVAHQTKVETQRVEQESRLARGSDIQILPDGTPDSAFEDTMAKFFAWCEANHFGVHELAKNRVSFQKVDPREIRASFKEYNPDASSLRSDMLVPALNSKTDVFLEMFFDKLGGEWEMFGTESAPEEPEEEDFDAHSYRFSEEMKRSS